MAITVNGKKVAGVGPAGLSPYQVAQAGGYTGTEQEFNEAMSKIGESGGAGKRVARFTVGTSAAGWTADDCDYLCDGTADDVEINAAIQALPSTGGEIVILDGTYNITATIAMNKDNVKLSGNGVATVLKRMWNSSTEEGIITVTAANGGCSVENLHIDGNKGSYTSSKNCGIYLKGENTTVTGNTCNNNSAYGVYLYFGSNNNTVTGNTCNNNNCGIYLRGNNSEINTVTGNICNNNDYGIQLAGSKRNTVTGNICNNNSDSGILLSSNESNSVTGNTCNNNKYGIYLYSLSKNNTVTGNTCCNNNNCGIYLIGSNTTVTGNTCCNNNSYGIYMQGENTTITGNTFNNNNCGIYLTGSNKNNTITGNNCIRGTGESSDYTSSQYTIQLNGVANNYNLIADNNIMGKNYTSAGGTSNTFINNKYS